MQYNKLCIYFRKGARKNAPGKNAPRKNAPGKSAPQK